MAVCTFTMPAWLRATEIAITAPSTATTTIKIKTFFQGFIGGLAQRDSTGPRAGMFRAPAPFRRVLAIINCTCARRRRIEGGIRGAASARGAAGPRRRIRKIVREHSNEPLPPTLGSACFRPPLNIELRQRGAKVFTLRAANLKPIAAAGRRRGPGGILASLLAFVAIATLAAGAQNPTPTATAPAVPPKLTAKQRRQQEKALAKELGGYYKKWLNEDVVYIITPEEREAFLQLKTDEERDQFIEAFWARRNPDPGSPYNSYKEEHYRRIAYANAHFAAGVPGWRTDRGRIYITFGPPDEIDSHPSGGEYERPIEEGGGETSTYPFEDWRYRYIDGVGTNVVIEFVDTTMSGEYHISLDPEEKDALLYVPGAGLTLSEQMGMSDKTQRFERTDGTHLGTGNDPLPESMNEFTRIEQLAKLQAPPPIKFKDLSTAVDSNIRYNTLPMMVRADYIRVTD